jgi:hypothetical protein
MFECADIQGIIGKLLCDAYLNHSSFQTYWVDQLGGSCLCDRGASASVPASSTPARSAIPPTRIYEELFIEIYDFLKIHKSPEWQYLEECTLFNSSGANFWCCWRSAYAGFLIASGKVPSDGNLIVDDINVKKMLNFVGDKVEELLRKYYNLSKIQECVEKCEGDKNREYICQMLLNKYNTDRSWVEREFKAIYIILDDMKRDGFRHIYGNRRLDLNSRNGQEEFVQDIKNGKLYGDYLLHPFMCAYFKSLDPNGLSYDIEVSLFGDGAFQGVPQGINPGNLKVDKGINIFLIHEQDHYGVIVPKPKDGSKLPVKRITYRARNLDLLSNDGMSEDCTDYVFGANQQDPVPIVK